MAARTLPISWSLAGRHGCTSSPISAVSRLVRSARTTQRNTASLSGWSWRRAITASAVPTATAWASSASNGLRGRGSAPPHSFRTWRTTRGGEGSRACRAARARQARMNSSLSGRVAAWPVAATPCSRSRSTCCWAVITSPSGGTGTAATSARACPHVRRRHRRLPSDGAREVVQAPARVTPPRWRPCGTGRVWHDGHVSTSRTPWRVHANDHGSRQASCHRPAVSPRQDGQ